MDISNHDALVVKDILNKLLSENSSAWIFGSRAKKAKKKYSDLDLAIKSSSVLSLGQLADLQQAFSESELPYKVDIVDLHKIEDNFLSAIQNDLVFFFKK